MNMFKIIPLVFCLIGLLIGATDLEKNPKLELEYSESPIDLQDIQAKFAADISYGPHERNEFDIFLPESEKSTPLVIFVHGGGFRGGDRSMVYDIQKDGKWDFPQDIRRFLKEDIAFATINYQLLDSRDSVGVMKCLLDSKRCLQYIRLNAAELGVDPERIAMVGNSAGAGTSLWMALHDDMMEEGAEESYLRQSTRIRAAAALETQATYDLDRWETDVFVDYNVDLKAIARAIPTLGQRVAAFYGVDELEETYLAKVLDYKNEVDMLDLMSEDDPDIYVSNTLRPVVYPLGVNLLNHHAYHARELKEKADEVGITCHAYYDGTADKRDEDYVAFFIRKLAK